MTSANEDTSPAWPYPPFRTLLNTLERMEGDAIPPRIDRSYLSGSEGTKTLLMKAMEFLGLTDGSGVPTDRLKELVAHPKQRPALFKPILEESYPGAVELAGINGTQAQLEELFEPLTGSTRRKAVAFYLKGAEYAKIALSPNFKTPREPGRPKGSRTRKKRQNGDAGSSTTPSPRQPPTDEAAQRARYVELLMKKAESGDELNSELLDRIEFLLGFRDAPDQDASDG